MEENALAVHAWRSKMKAEPNTVYIKRHQFIQCKCQRLSYINEDICANQFPVLIECSFCLEKVLLIGTEIFPKVIPPQDMSNVSAWKVIAPGESKEIELDRKESAVITGIDLTTPDSINSMEGLEAEEIVDRAEPHYNVLAKQLKENLKQGIALVAKMEIALEQFASDMERDMRKSVGQAVVFKKYWRLEYVKDFISEPINSIELSLENQDLANGTRLVFSPNFLAVNFGIPISTSKGMRSELVTPFTRISRSINGAYAEALGLPDEPKLFVHGKKIIGRELSYLWNQIPGIIQDIDSTPQDPSVVINDCSAREWLALRGVRPWAINPIKEILTSDQFNSSEVIFETEILPEFSMPWIKLEKCGRVGVWWNNVVMLRKFGLFCLEQIRGAKLILTCGSKDEVHWKSIDSSLNRKGVTFKDNSVVFECFVNIDDIEEYLSYNVIVLDLCNIPWDRKKLLDNLYSVLYGLFKYNGVLVVLGNDPILDLEGDCSLHIKSHTLAGFEIYDNVDIEIDPKYSAKSYSKLIANLRRFHHKKNNK